MIVCMRKITEVKIQQNLNGRERQINIKVLQKHNITTLKKEEEERGEMKQPHKF